MSTAVRVLGLREVLFALALVGALSGLVGMHHVLAFENVSGTGTTPAAVQYIAAAEAAHAPPAAPVPDGEHDGHGGSELLHLCLAVLASAVGVAIALFLLRRGRATSTVSRGRAPNGSIGSRAPPLPVPRRLALLCVLRT